MRYYRLYFWGRSGIAGFEEFQADDDRAATGAALSHARGLDMELWNGTRLVGTFTAERRAG